MADAPATNYATIKVIGIGGAGCNALYRILTGMNGNYQSNVTYIAMNTDSQHLGYFSEEKIKEKMNGHIVQLSGEKGLGAGGNPQVGERIMNEAIAAGKLENIIEGNEDLVIVTAGMGGGTGTGGVPIFCKHIVEKSPNAVIVFIGTQTYTFEGDERKRNADYGCKNLIEIPEVKRIIIENDDLLTMAEAEYAKQQPQEGKRRRKGIPASVAFGYSDMVLTDGISVVTDLITVRTMVNLDMKDAQTVMSAGPTIRFGRALSDESDDRAMNALESILVNPIYRNPINGGSAYLIAFYGDVDTGEMNAVVNQIKALAQPGANIIFGGIGGKEFKEGQDKPQDIIEIALIATGFEDTVKVGAEEKAAENRVKQTAAGAESAEIEYEGGSFKLNDKDED